MPVALVSLRMPTLSILFGRNFRNSFTLSEDAKIITSIQRSVCALYCIQASFLFVQSQFEQKKEECKQMLRLDNHREQWDKAIKALQTQKHLQFQKVWGSLNTLRTGFKWLPSKYWLWSHKIKFSCILEAKHLQQNLTKTYSSVLVPLNNRSVYQRNKHFLLWKNKNEVKV